MKTNTVSRRDFLHKFSLKKADDLPGQGDPLFDKYSRKSSGPRIFDTTLVDFFRDQKTNRPGNELRVGNITSGLAPYTGIFGKSEAIMILQRTGFGYKKSGLDATLATGSVSAAIDKVININPAIPAPPVNWYNNIKPDENNISYGTDVTKDSFVNGTIGQTTNTYRTEGLRYWLMMQALNQDNTIREKMILFWYHFIPTDFDTVRTSANQYVNTNSARIEFDYMNFLRQNVLGNFKTMIRNIATQPAMMFYLNNQSNTATAPDENFARELMELFTLGKGPLSKYTQADVVAAAQVLTGWRVQNLNTTNTTTDFITSKHKTGNKQFSSFFNNKIIQNGGAAELDALIDMIFNKSQVVSQYICRRLYRFFVYYDIDDNIETNVIVPLAQTFVNENWNILPVLKQLFKSEHFFDMANRGVYIKSPLDFVVGSMRNFNLNYNVTDPSNYEAQYRMISYLHDSLMFPMEQRFGDVPNVSGWNAFYQTPAFHEYWINTNTIQKRFVYIDAIFNGYKKTYNGLTTTVKIDVIAYVQQFPNSVVQDPNLLVAECLSSMLPVPLSDTQKQSLKLQTILYQQVSDYYWTTAWNNYLANPSNTVNAAIVKDRLQSLLYSICQLAEFQLM